MKRLRILRVLWFCLCAVPLLLLRRRPDLIVTQTNPPLIVPAVALAAALRRVPLVIIAQDVYPDVLFVSGAANPTGRLAGLLRALFSWAYRRAARVVVLGPFMQRRVEAKGVGPDRIVSISNWATGETGRYRGTDNPWRAKWGLQGRFVVMYSGNIGVGHEFGTFLEGVRTAAVRHPELNVLFVGAGSRLEEVRAQVADLGLRERVQFQDFVRAEDLPLTLGVADVALVTLREGFSGVIVPSKLLGYMARGIPTLYVGPESDISDMVRAANCGECCVPGQSDAVARVLCKMMESGDVLERWQRNAQAYYSEHLSREIALRRYVGLVQEVLHSG